MRPLTVATILATPRSERQWLTTLEAAEHAGVSVHGIRSWTTAGLLPNTDRTRGPRLLYLRADVDRIVRAPRYCRRGVDRIGLHAQLEVARLTTPQISVGEATRR